MMPDSVNGLDAAQWSRWSRPRRSHRSRSRSLSTQLQMFPPGHPKASLAAEESGAELFVVFEAHICGASG